MRGKSVLTDFFWKIYLCISIIIAGWNLIALVEKFLGLHISMGVGPILVTIVYALAVHSYINKKHIFSQDTWKIWLGIVLLTHILIWAPLLYDFFLNFGTNIIFFFEGIIFTLPAWYCIYRLGFGKKTLL